MFHSPCKINRLKKVLDGILSDKEGKAGVDRGRKGWESQTGTEESHDLACAKRHLHARMQRPLVYSPWLSNPREKRRTEWRGCYVLSVTGLPLQTQSLFISLQVTCQSQERVYVILHTDILINIYLYIWPLLKDNVSISHWDKSTIISIQLSGKWCQCNLAGSASVFYLLHSFRRIKKYLLKKLFVFAKRLPLRWMLDTLLIDLPSTHFPE